MAKITDPYLNRVISQHKIRPKFMSWLAAINELVEDTMNLYRSFDEAFNLETAVGAQLDVLGKIAGVDRLLNFEPVYAVPLLSDEYYRMLIKAKISLNHWNGTTEGIFNLWDEIMGGYRLEVVDHQDMTMTLRVMNLSNLFESEFIARGYLAPKPQTVFVNYEFILTREIETDLYVGGVIPNDYIRFALEANTSDFGAVTGDLHTAGAITGDYIRFELGNGLLEDTTITGSSKVGGQLAIMDRFTLSSTERG